MKVFYAFAALLISDVCFAHGLIQDPPSRNWFCGAVTKPDQVVNGVAQYPVCGGAFANDFSGGYSFMSVLTHAQGRSVVRPLPENVCGFNSETWQGKSTPWDQPIDWPTTNISAGSRTFSWNISWGSHFSDTKEFKYWITKPGFQYQVGRPLTWADFEDAPFCSLDYDDANPGANPNVVPDKARAMFHTQCTVPQRQGRHVIYAEWGRNQWTFERFHGCVDVVIGGSSAPGFGLSTPTTTLNVTAGQSVSATINVARNGGFTGPVAFTATGLPSGVTASFNPASVTGTSTVLTLSSTAAASIGSASVVVTGTSGTLTSTVPVALNVIGSAEFSLSSAGGTVSLPQGTTATRDIAITRTAGFTAPVSFSVSGLPSGVTASFNPANATGAATTLSLFASGSAATGTTNVVVTGTSGALTRTASVAVNVTSASVPSFTLPAVSAVTLNQGGSGTASIAINRLNGLTAPVTLTASQLPAGITASFNPATTSGSGSVLTLSAAASAITGAGTVLVTGTSGSITQTVSVPFTVSGGSGTGQITVTPRVNINQPWYNELVVQLTNSLPITQFSLTITVQRTAGVAYAGQYNTIGGQIQQSNASTGSSVVYKYVLSPGQSLPGGSYKVFAAQASGSGTAHPTAGDTYELTYTVGGTSFTQTGHF